MIGRYFRFPSYALRIQESFSTIHIKTLEDAYVNDTRHVRQMVRLPCMIPLPKRHAAGYRTTVWWYYSVAEWCF